MCGREFKAGNLRGDAGDSLSINMDTGRWADFATGARGGDLISLYAALHGLTQPKAAVAIAAELGIDIGIPSPAAKVVPPTVRPPKEG